MPKGYPNKPKEGNPTTNEQVANTEAQAISEQQAWSVRRPKEGELTGVLPGGVRTAVPFIHARYNPANAESDLLGNPETIVSESFKSEHRGWKYMWPIASSARTQAYIRSGAYVEVPFESGIDQDNPLAAVSQSPTGATTWMQHILVAVSPQNWSTLVESAEIRSMQQAAMNRSMVEADLNKELGSGAYTAKFDEFTDQRKENIR
jgi:hypothetical protein